MDPIALILVIFLILLLVGIFSLGPLIGLSANTTVGMVIILIIILLLVYLGRHRL